MSRTKIKLDLQEVLKIYDSFVKPCPICGEKTIPMDWSDYCPHCKKSFKRKYDFSEETIINESKVTKSITNDTKNIRDLPKIKEENEN